jgi:hypothetical protein
VGTPNTEKALRERCFQAMLQATFAIQQEQADQEVTLKALIDAAGLLRERFEMELAELRLEEAE